MKILKLTLGVLFSLSIGCEVDTRQCESVNDCFSGEACIENSCLSPAELQAQKKKNGTSDTGIDDGDNNGENNGVILSCDENGTLNIGEDCENGLALTQTCETLGYDSGMLKCSDCQFDTSSCVTEPSTCGDGMIQGLEACDGDEFENETCQSQIGAGSTGTLSCSGSCVINSSNCSTVYTHISANSGHTCAVDSQGDITCWGTRDEEVLTPTIGKKYVKVSAGSDYSCGLGNQGGVACWGNYGSNVTVPDGKFESLDSSSGGSCAIAPDKTVSCWGFRYQNGATTPVGDVLFTQVSIGETHSCGVSGGAIKCWSGSTEIELVPLADNGSTFTHVSAGWDYTCALMSNNNIVCWDKEGAKVAIPPGNFTQISVLYSHVCALDTDQNVKCWDGYEGFDAFDADLPTEKFTQVTAGRYHGCGIMVDGAIKCWGRENLIEIP